MIYEFMATQSFNGYDKPWAGGAGTNKYPGNTDLFPILTDQVYSVSSGTADQAGRLSISVYDENSERITLSETDVSSLNGVYVTAGGILYLGSDRSILTDVRFAITNPDAVYISLVNTNNFPNIQVEAGATVSAYEPYANVCMPEGFNIWDPTNAEYIQVYAGYVNANTRELYLRPVYKEYAGEELVGPWMSSLDLYSEDSTPTEGAFVIDFGGELTSYEITPFMLQTLLDSLGIRQHFLDGASLLNSLMDQAQGRVRSEEELLHLSRPLNVITIGDQLPVGLTFKPISKDVLPGLPGKFIR